MTEPDASAVPEPPPPTPAAPTSSAAPPALPPRLELLEVNQNKRKWSLDLHPDHLALHSEFDPQPLIYTRAELWDKADVMEDMRLLALKKPRVIGLQFTPEGLQTFRAWMKPSEAARLRVVLKRRYSFALLLAMLIGFSSLPIRGDAADGTRDVSWDPVGLALAISLGAVWLWAKFRPMRVIFLVDAVWFTLAAARNFINIAQNDRHWAWGLFGLILLWIAARGVMWFRRFSPPKPVQTAPGG